MYLMILPLSSPFVTQGTGGVKGDRGVPGERGDRGVSGKDGLPGERGSSGLDVSGLCSCCQ